MIGQNDGASGEKEGKMRRRTKSKHDWSGDNVTKRDLKSDVALWALYKRWCRHHKIRRTTEEMLCRFINFKRNAIRICGNKHKNRPYVGGLSHLADKADEERRFNRNR